MELRVLFRCTSPSVLFFYHLLTICLVLYPVFGERTRVFVTVLFRHGDRSPIRAYPTDPYQESAWPQGFGQLSQEGMRQHFLLGQRFRQRYHGLFNSSYKRHEIVVRSTDVDRTLMSAEANLAGLYPPNGSQVFNPDLTWQPVPVHTVPEAQDRLLVFPLPGCPRYESLMNETKQSDIFVNMTIVYKDFLEMVRNKTGLKDASLESVWRIHDTLFCEASHNMTLPAWATQEVMEKLRDLKDFSFSVLFGLYKQQDKCRLQGGVLLDQILKNISALAVNGSQNPLKMMMYSAHDTTIVALQSALNVFDGKQPPYASCHMFELFREDDGSFSIAMFYWKNNSTEPSPVQLPGCVQYCPLQDFIRLTKPVIPVNWQEECQLASDNKDAVLIFGLTFCGSTLLLLIGLLLILLYHRKNTRSIGYSHVTNEGDDHS